MANGHIKRSFLWTEGHALLMARFETHGSIQAAARHIADHCSGPSIPYSRLITYRDGRMPRVDDAIIMELHLGIPVTAWTAPAEDG